MMMTRKHFRFFVATAIATSLLVVAPSFQFGTASNLGAAWAQKKKAPACTNKIPARPKRRAPTVAPSLAKQLEKIGTKISEESLYDEATADLTKMLGRKQASYGIAMIHYHIAWAAFEKDDIKAAVRSYETIMNQPKLPYSFEDNIRYSLAQLYFAEERYQDSLRLLNEWFKYQACPQASHWVFLGQLYYTLERFKDAVGPIEKAIQLYRDAELKPKENWYSLLKTINYEFGNVQKVREILEILVLEYPPKAQNWLQLAGIYSELKNEANQLAAMEVAYDKGYLIKESHLLNLAQLYMYHEAPIKAVWVMKTGLDGEIIKKTKKNYDTYSQALMYAQEYNDAVDPLESAAKLSDDGELYDRLGQVYIQIDQWGNAVTALKNALKKGDLDREDLVLMSLGMAHYNLDQLDSAAKVFRDARKFKKSKKQSNTWIKFITNEKLRREKLREAMR